MRSCLYLDPSRFLRWHQWLAHLAVRGDRAVWRVSGDDGRTAELATDHVIAATGYGFALEALPFLRPGLASQLRSTSYGRILSPDFESSVPGVYFCSLASALDFRPAMRFVYGVHFTVRSMSGHIATAVRHGSRLCEIAGLQMCKEASGRNRNDKVARQSGNGSAPPFDTTVPVLVGQYVPYHGTLGIIRSLRSAGIPYVCTNPGDLVRVSAT